MSQAGGDWSTSSNDAVSISLVTPDAGNSKAIASFKPKFTYHIFGEEETIFGYQGLKIHLKYNASDMRPVIEVSYDKKFKAVADTEATDIPAMLGPYLPKGAFDKSSVFNLNINDEIYQDWKPPGELLKTFISVDTTYEIWKGNLIDKPIQQLLKRIQILVPLFIEGGSFINIDEDPEWSIRRWSVFLMYKKRSPDEALKCSPYVFTGYSTVYNYYPYQPSKRPTTPSQKTRRAADFVLPFPKSSEPNIASRSRISQFIILPPFQGGGNGSRLYETIFLHYLNDPHTVEVTVEDPNESFDDLRDLNDLMRLRPLPEFDSIRINRNVVPRSKGKFQANLTVDLEAREKLRKRVKIAPRQFIRLVEMQLLSRLPMSIRKSLLLEKKTGTALENKALEHEYHLWQLFVKQRLYRHNKDSLAQLDLSERIEKLNETLENVEADYGRLLRILDARHGTNGVPGMATAKRTLVEDVIEDVEPAMKKARVEYE